MEEGLPMTIPWRIMDTWQTSDIGFPQNIGLSDPFVFTAAWQLNETNEERWTQTKILEIVGRADLNNSRNGNRQEPEIVYNFAFW